MQFFLILALLLVVLAVVFAAQNMTAITITFITWTIHTNLAVALAVAVIGGAIIAVLLSIPGNIKSGVNASGSKKKLNFLETERDQLKDRAEKAEKEVAELELQLASYTAELEKQSSLGQADPGELKSPE